MNSLASAARSTAFRAIWPRILRARGAASRRPYCRCASSWGISWSSTAFGAGFCRLDLDGAYSPPLGPAGALFDAVLGKRIAQATVGDLLLRLRRICEEAYAAEHGAETPG